MLHVRVIHSGRSLRAQEDACRAAGLVIQATTYEQGYPIYGHIDPSRLEALRAVLGVDDVVILSN